MISRFQTLVAVMLASLVLGAVAPAWAKKTYTPCPPGRYVVRGAPLIVGPVPLEHDAITYGDEVAIDSGCAPVTPIRVKATKAGTRSCSATSPYAFTVSKKRAMFRTFASFAGVASPDSRASHPEARRYRYNTSPVRRRGTSFAARPMDLERSRSSTFSPVTAQPRA